MQESARHSEGFRSENTVLAWLLGSTRSRATPAVRHRLRLILRFSVFGAAVAWSFAAYGLFALQSHVFALALAGTGFAILIPPLLYRATGSLGAAAHAMATVLLAVTCFATLQREGMTVSALIYLAPLPLLILYVTGIRAALFWTAIAIVTYGVFAIRVLGGFAANTIVHASPEAMLILDALGLVGLTLLILFLAATYQASNAVADQERAAAETRLQIAERLESVGRVAAGVSHDFNNLLTVILGTTEAVKQQMPATDPAYNDILEIESAARDAADLVAKLLLFSRRQPAQRAVTNVNKVIDRAGSLLRSSVRDDIRLDLRLAESLWRCRFDGRELQRVLINLVTNARDAMPAGGTLTIETANEETTESTVALPKPMDPGRYTRLTIRDDGVGMTPELAARVFEPFFTTKGAGLGTGLGLSTTYGIIKRYGGFIGVESEVGQGTTFDIFLPATDEPEDELAEIETETAAADCGGSESILLVEDNARVRAVARMTLADAGYRVVESPGGADAMRIAAARHQPFDMLLTDVVMPGMSGPELSEHLSSAQPAIKVLFMTGYSDAETLQLHLDSGSTVPLRKPFSERELLRRVRERLNTHA